MSQLKIYKELDLTSSSCAGPIGELSSVLEEIRQGEAIKRKGKILYSSK